MNINFGPVSPTTGLEEWDRLPKWAVLVPDVVRAPTVYKTGLGAETDGTQQLAQTAGAPGDGWKQSDSGVRYGISHFLKASAGLRTAQRISPRDGVPRSHCTDAETEVKDIAGPARAGPPFSSLSCPSILQGKGPLSPRD